jgi:hypothetical protein
MDTIVSRPKGMENAEVVLRTVRTPLARRIGFFMMHAMDLNFAARWFMHATKIPKKNELEFKDAYVHAALMAYRRCCNIGQRTQRQKGYEENRIQARDAERVMPAEGAELHQQMLQLADRLVAHSHNDYERVAIGARCLLDRERGLHAFVDAWGITTKYLTYGKNETLKSYGLLCFLLEKEYVRPEMERMYQLLAEELRQKRPDQLFSLPICMFDVVGGPPFDPADPRRKYHLPVRGEDR